LNFKIGAGIVPALQKLYFVQPQTMTSYLINSDPDTSTLKVDFNRNLPQSGDRIVKDAVTRLDELIQSGELAGGALLKINGPASVLVSYVMAHKLTHLYGAIAVSDPRLGAYVVVKSNNPDYPVGSRIDFITGVLTNSISANRSEESSFCMEVVGDVLKVQFNSEQKVDGDRIVKDVESCLNRLIETRELTGGKLLKINGRSSVLASYVIAEKLAHLYGAIALYDPKIGDVGLDKYVVVISHNPDYQIGDTIHLKIAPQSSLKVVICGSANTGKTCFREGLKTALLNFPQAPLSYVISGCPDGDGSWFSETAQKHPELAKELKQKYKASFTPEFAIAKAKDIQAIKTPLLVFDVGGEISPENEVIMPQATHAVILAKTDAEVKDWEEFCQKLGLPVIAVIYSDLNATKDEIYEVKSAELLRGKIHCLKRGEDTSERAIVKALSELLVGLTLG
jgi:CRISPR-associated protein Csx3